VFPKYVVLMQQDKSDSVLARPSATVVLVREGKPDPEILMVKRRAGDAFGDSYAFPGGVVDDDEFEARPFCRGMTAEHADAELGLPGGGLDYYSAVVRELFEETGVLLARDSRGKWAFSDNSDAESILLELRKKLDDGVMSWAEILRIRSLCIACDALHYFSFWETPLRLPKRWAARFFLAELPPGQDAQHDGSELTDSCWMTAAEILSSSMKGGMNLPLPTLTNLKIISGFGSVDDLLSWASTQAADEIQKIRPVILNDNGRTRFVIPGDPDYPQDGDQ
jgi:8-oxo-dGTP pyrophosphatase MutT (NUDIX family)